MRLGKDRIKNRYDVEGTTFTQKRPAMGFANLRAAKEQYPVTVVDTMRHLRLDIDPEIAWLMVEEKKEQIRNKGKA
jgi:hypothetical protein